MQYTKTECERLIRESPLFRLDREREPIAYKRESEKMVEYLYYYSITELGCNVNDFLNGCRPGGKECRRKSKWNWENDGQSFRSDNCIVSGHSQELVETAISCIKSYDSAKGDFLHYYNHSWKNKRNAIKSEAIINSRFSGMSISKDDRILIKEYEKAILECEKKGLPFESNIWKSSMSKEMNVSLKTVDEVKRMIEEREIIKTTTIGSEGNEYSVLDMQQNILDTEDDYIHKERLFIILKSMENAYNMLQSRQKPLIADLTTVKEYDLLLYAETLNINVMSFSFINYKILDLYKKTGTLLTQRQIAIKYGRDERSLSRSFRTFEEMWKKEYHR